MVNNKLRIPETLRQVKNIVGVFSAKGGVGKSAVSLQLAMSLQSKGFKVGLVDADIYGPSQAVMLNSEPGELKITNNKIYLCFKVIYCSTPAATLTNLIMPFSDVFFISPKPIL